MTEELRSQSRSESKTPRCDALVAGNNDPTALTEEWEELARELEARHEAEIDEFNEGFDAHKNGVAFNDLECRPNDNNLVGWAWAAFQPERFKRVSATATPRTDALIAAADAVPETRIVFLIKSLANLAKDLERELAHMRSETREPVEELREKMLARALQRALTLLSNRCRKELYDDHAIILQWLQGFK